jgi:hypothetical protein
MSRSQRRAAMLAFCTALAGAPVALASGGGGGGGGSQSCVPLTTVVGVAHADGNGQSGISVQATVRNCSRANEHMHLTVTVPNSGTVPFNQNLAASPGRPLTLIASPIGSTPLLLHYGQTYTVVATLTNTDNVPATVLGTTTTTVTMPPGVVR